MSREKIIGRELYCKLWYPSFSCFLIPQRKNFGYCKQNLDGLVQTSSVQTFQPIILIYIQG